jgi:alpha-galactosidase
MHALRGTRDGVEDVSIGYIGGGSRSWAITMMNDLARTADLCGTVRLYDLDHQSAVHNAELGAWIQSHDAAVGEWTYEAVVDRRDALAGADVVIVSTQDPPAETFAHDCEVPKDYGIYQTVGDTVGPGGAFRALRAIPQYREIAAAVREHCPDALVINYTNPMTVCTRTLHREFPEINAIGLCHEVFGAQRFLAHLASEAFEADVSMAAIDATVKGINHFTWIDEATWQGRNLLPLLDDLGMDEPMPRFFATGPGGDRSVNNQRITLDLYRRFGVMPAAGDRHVAEFVPWYLAVEDPAALGEWNVSVATGENRRTKWERGERERESLLEGDDRFEFYDSGEEMVDVMRAWLGLGALKTNVNAPNRGQIEGIRRDAVVETNALITEGSVTPLAAGGLPDPVESLVRTHVSNQETLVEAGFRGALDHAFRAFLNDPLMGIDRDQAAALFRELAEIQADYLDTYDLASASITNSGR